MYAFVVVGFVVYGHSDTIYRFTPLSRIFTKPDSRRLFINRFKNILNTNGLLGKLCYVDVYLQIKDYEFAQDYLRNNLHQLLVDADFFKAVTLHSQSTHICLHS